MLIRRAFLAAPLSSSGRLRRCSRGGLPLEQDTILRLNPTLTSLTGSSYSLLFFFLLPFRCHYDFIHQISFHSWTAGSATRAVLAEHFADLSEDQGTTLSSLPDLHCLREYIRSASLIKSRGSPDQITGTSCDPRRVCCRVAALAVLAQLKRDLSADVDAALRLAWARKNFDLMARTCIVCNMVVVTSATPLVTRSY